MADLFTPAFPDLVHQLRSLKFALSAGEYLILSFFNSLFYSLLLFLLLLPVFFFANPAAFSPAHATANAFLPSSAAFILLLLFFCYYPTILLRKQVERLDRDLIFALKDLSIQVSSGLTLYEAIHNVSKGGYGTVSTEFEQVVRDINSGLSEEEALSRLADRTDSQFLKRVTWQIINVLRSGASLQGALAGIISSLRESQKERITQYTQEMNLWVLVFLVLAVALPSLWITVLAVLFSFGGVGLSPLSFYIFLGACFLAEFLLIQYIKLKRPLVYL